MNTRSVSRDDEAQALMALIQDPSTAANLPLDQLAALAFRFAAITTVLAAQLAEARARSRLDDGSQKPMSVEEAAQHACCSEYTICEQARAGRIPGATKPGKRWRFTREGLDRWISSRRGR